ncbi:MAG: right-handed parallel beta-helix repeat-containing protein [Gemmataceae bacterium]
MSSIQRFHIFFVVVIAGTLICPKTRANEADERPEVRVGIDDGEIRGGDHRAIQAAIDYVANFGGGTVRIGPGRYVLRNSITLRDHIRILGTEGKTVLAPVEGAKTALAADGDANQRTITLADPSGFKVGDRVLISDDHYSSGFDLTSAVLISKNGKATFRLSEPLRNDYMVHRHGRVELTFPAVGGWNIRDAAVEDVTIEGTRGQTPCKAADGCRHGGIYRFECAEVTIQRCVVRSFNGDGISFQVSRGVTVEKCFAEKNAGLGLHPGSGSERPVVRHCLATDNGGDGLFVCWRVRNGQFEDNELRGNQGVGISIGHKDCDNLFRGNRITANKGVGLLFREEAEAMGAHRNVFEKNVFLDNGLPTKGNPAACIVIQGHHHDLVFRNNIIGVTSEKVLAAVGIAAGKEALRLEANDNEFRGVKEAVHSGK